jgi:PGF-CTERM protein
MSDRGLNSADTSQPGARHAVALGLVLLSVIVAGAALGGMIAAELQSGPIEVSDWTDLDDIRNDLDADYVLVNDLDETTTGYDTVAGPNANGGKGFDPIGGFLDRFSGSFDGQGNSIANLTIDRPNKADVGLFGYTSGGAVIEGVILTGATVTGSEFGVGGLVGSNSGTVSTSSASGNVTGSFEVGGLVGSNNFDGTVSTSSASGNVTGFGDVGGLVGRSDGTVSTSSASGNVTDSSGVGGFATGRVGGLVGYNDNGTVSNSSASGAVNGFGDVGGLVGENDGTVSTSSASGAVNGSSDVGGLVGQNNVAGTVSTSSASGNVTGSEEVGGLVGRLGSGFLEPGEEAILRDSYYDNQTTEQQSAVGTIAEGNGTAELRGEVAGLPTSQMQGASAAQNMGALDFTSTWQTVTAPAGYPELQAGPPPAAERGPDIEDTDIDGENGDAGNGGNGDGGNGGDGFGPGFGPVVVLAGLSGAGYLLKRRGTTNDTDAE